VNNGLIVSGGGTITAMDPQGMSVHVLDSALPQNSRAQSPAWSPDGSSLAFEVDGDIAVMDLRGENVQQLTVSETSFERQPAWSPDGSQIAFMRDGQLWTMNADGTGQRQVTTVCCNNAPSWAPDGTKLAFESDRSGAWQIHVLDLAAGEPAQQLTVSEGENRWPDWSPDGSSLAFASTRRNGVQDIWTMNADGSNQTALTSRPYAPGYPAWSPDGQHVLYTEGGEVRMVGRDGAGDQRVGGLGPEPDWQPLPPCTITGTEEPEHLVGTAGADVICGLGGNDAVSAGPGDDIVLGGAGEDTVMFDQNFSGVEVDLPATSVVGEGRDLVLLMENASGSHGNDVIIGNEDRNYLRGADGDDVVDGGPNSDRLEGGVGTDTLSLSDTGAATVDLSTGVSRHDLELDDLSMFENVLGSQGNDRLHGDSGPNVLDGGFGANWITGGRGNDTMIGGTADYSDAPNGVRVDLVAGWATGAGEDTLIDVTGVMGSTHDDWLRGPAFGRGGDDTVVVTDPDVGMLSGGRGVDTLDLTGLHTPVKLDLSAFLTPRGHHDIPVPQFENAIGTSFADVIRGNSGPNVLGGRDGSDDLFGGSGEDLLIGGRGEDELYAGRGADILHARDAYADLVDGGLHSDDCVVDGRDLVRRCP
jgi:Ca2+-binding RTX toxin-like protein